MKPTPAKPRIIIAQVEGSGTAETLPAVARKKEPDNVYPLAKTDESPLNLPQRRPVTHGINVGSAKFVGFKNSKDKTISLVLLTARVSASLEIPPMNKAKGLLDVAVKLVKPSVEPSVIPGVNEFCVMPVVRLSTAIVGSNVTVKLPESELIGGVALLKTSTKPLRLKS